MNSLAISYVELLRVAAGESGMSLKGVEIELRKRAGSRRHIPAIAGGAGWDGLGSFEVLVRSVNGLTRAYLEMAMTSTAMVASKDGRPSKRSVVPEGGLAGSKNSFSRARVLSSTGRVRV